MRKGMHGHVCFFIRHSPRRHQRYEVMGIFTSLQSALVKMVKKVHVAIIFEDGKYYIRTRQDL